ncbi:hypothetical protein VZT92_014697 [Zoarces viviparus]|uniref:Uncharacterized protein n=1 Tax=Zoarces viviparus TaxID=48416 RepID=A0AAW1F0K8_ZOAVI
MEYYSCKREQSLNRSSGGEGCVESKNKELDKWVLLKRKQVFSGVLQKTKGLQLSFAVACDLLTFLDLSFFSRENKEVIFLIILEVGGSRFTLCHQAQIFS